MSMVSDPSDRFIPRPIEFRAWDKKEKRMISAHATILDEHIDIGFDGAVVRRETLEQYVRRTNDPHYQWQVSDRYVITQYTGLKDKNGNKIFEGDIVEWKEAGYRNIVVWHREHASFTLDDWHVDWFDDYERREFVIIGNIFKNPELLK